MALRINTIATATRSNGSIIVRFAGSKQGRVFSSMQNLRQAVRAARQYDFEHRFLLALGDALDSDANLANISVLNGVQFQADDGV